MYTTHKTWPLMWNSGKRLFFLEKVTGRGGNTFFKYKYIKEMFHHVVQHLIFSNKRPFSFYPWNKSYLHHLADMIDRNGHWNKPCWTTCACPNGQTWPASLLLLHVWNEESPYVQCARSLLRYCQLQPFWKEIIILRFRGFFMGARVFFFLNSNLRPILHLFILFYFPMQMSLFYSGFSC